jgi:ribosomal protein S27AE
MPPQMTRLMIIFGLLIALYIVVRWVSKPESFYWYGHYRGAALAEIANLPVEHSEKSACGDCHTDEFDENLEGVHHTVNCQICHGAGEAHVLDPTMENILLPEGSEMCKICHTQNSARPKDFPQIDVAEHSEWMACDECHMVHNPGEFQ